MITFQCATFEEYLSIRESHPQFFTSNSPAIRPPVVKQGVKGECEKAYNSKWGIFRFTDEQKEIFDTLSEKEGAEFREFKCAECLASDKRNGWKEGSKGRVPREQGESERGETWQGEEVEPSEGMFD
jgi:hypothetical protein